MPYFSNFLLLGCIFCFLSNTLEAQTNYWPTGTWRYSAPEQQGMDSEKLIQMLEIIQKESYAIDSILIVRNGYIVMEAYFFPFQKKTKHAVHSVTKSIISILIGIALEKGNFQSTQQAVFEFFPKKQIANLDQNKWKITLEHLLTMSSGLEAIFSSKEHKKMLENDDWVQYILNLPLINPPGKDFEYSSGDAHLLSAILQRTTKMNALEFANIHLFGPLGIKNTIWLSDPQGISIGTSGIMLTTQDMAKIGLLYLEKGRWENKQVVSKKWINTSIQRKISANLLFDYGYLWWIDSPRIYIPYLWKWGLKWGKKQNPSDEYFMAIGRLGQYISVIAKKNMVVVFSSNLESAFDPLALLTPKVLLDQYIIPAASSSTPLKEVPQKKAYFDSLIESFATDSNQKFYWNSKENGIAQSGAFQRTKAPALQFKYPNNSIKQKLHQPEQIMLMKTWKEGYFSVSIHDSLKGLEIEKVGVRKIIKILKKQGAYSFKVNSNKKIILNDGTMAYKAEIDWKSSFVPNKWKTLQVSVFKQGKWIFLNYSFPFNNLMHENIEEGTSIIESLTFRH